MVMTGTRHLFIQVKKHRRNRSLGNCRPREKVGANHTEDHSAQRQVISLVSDADQQDDLRRMIDPDESVERTPARLLQPINEVVILVDHGAADG